jgi:uncharacterized protein YggE
MAAGLGVTAALVAAMLSACAASAQGQPGTLMERRTIRVSGVGEVQVRPDLATVQFAVETTGTTAREASEANADAMDAVIRALRGAGVAEEDIRTSGYSLYPEYAMQTREDPNAPPSIRGYRASNQVSVRTRDLESVGRLIDAGLAAGANRMNGVSFEVRDSKAAEAEALTLAVQSARASAETIAAALGVRLGEVLDASTSSQPPQPLYRQMEIAFDARASMAAAPTPIQPGEQSVYANASVVFAIE